MVERSEQDRVLRSGGERLLMTVLATVVWNFLSIAKFVPPDEAILIGWTVGFLVGYWLPPRPTIGFFYWSSERLVMLGVLYALVLKMPLLIAPSLNTYVAYGIGIVIFLVAYFFWTHHPKSTLATWSGITNT